MADEAEDRLILSATEALSAAMRDRGVTRTELARRMGINKSAISQQLGGRNISLRWLARAGHAIGVRFSVVADEGGEVVSGEFEPVDNPLPTRPNSAICGRCEAVFVDGGGRISVERFPGESHPPQVGTNGLCESCYADAIDRLVVFLMEGGPNA